VKKQTLVKLRSYQAEVFFQELRRCFLLWRRQLGKSYTLANKAMQRMVTRPNHTCIFTSANMAITSEFLLKEAQVWSQVLAAMKKYCDANSKQYRLTGDAIDDKGDVLDVDAIADMFVHSKLETRIWHSNAVYSRSHCVAPNPATAVGWTGDVFMDELGRIQDLRDLMEAVRPFMYSNPEFIWWMATTPPPDEAHYSFDLFAPPQETWPVNPLGNWYVSKTGIKVHRFDCFDAHVAGFPLFDDDSGLPITPEESRAKEFDKAAWDRNCALKFIRGGTTAIPYQCLIQAENKGADQGFAVNVTDTLEAEVV
jgi:hypothetical protein